MLERACGPAFHPQIPFRPLKLCSPFSRANSRSPGPKFVRGASPKWKQVRGWEGGGGPPGWTGVDRSAETVFGNKPGLWKEGLRNWAPQLMFLCWVKG